MAMPRENSSMDPMKSTSDQRHQKELKTTGSEQAPEKGWFVAHRLYCLLDPGIDKSWKSSELEFVK
jgi:hypothetical protein